VKDFLGGSGSVSAGLSPDCATRPCDEEFRFRIVAVSSLSSAVRSIKSNSVGLDGLSLGFLRDVFPLVEGQLLHLVNFGFLTGVYGWKGSSVVPVAERTTCVDVSDFRPISILPVLSKMFEVLVG
jgi:hypothetical protein